VEAGELRFDETLAEALPEDAARMDPAYRRVTLLQLLSHTAGLPSLTSGTQLPAYMAIASRSRGVREQRAAIARHALASPPTTPIGQFQYSNLGFIVAGAVAEARTGKSWEELLRERVFAPLGITHAGFGPPGSAAKVDQPRGHQLESGKLVALPPGKDADNPPWLGPAGTIHITLEDWMRFASDQMDGALGRGKLLRPENYRRLFTPVTGNYALGWGAKMDDDHIASVITHTGSNGYWLAEVRIMPKQHAILLVAMNSGGEDAAAAMQEITKAWREGLPKP
ncbi:MAG TPA: serine hydrolase domain-containing protein, partial [Usitatibacter sp.]|nr:serine hydrolase domain-containing protein [Usitatibacter sp.]